MRISFRPLPLSPVRMNWEARITRFLWNEEFCDEQVGGPFAAWLHCHSVLPQQHEGVAGTLVTDSVRYALPLGKLGDSLNTFAVRAQLARLFAFRQQRLRELLACENPTPHPQS